jgi:uncharacterized membrane protein YhaH (DUF805 family)
MNKRPVPAFKDRILERLLAENPRTGMSNYWGFIVVGSIMLLLPVISYNETFAALSLWWKGAPMDTLTPSGQIGRLDSLHYMLGYCVWVLVFFVGSISSLIIGITAHVVRCKRVAAGDAADL